MESSVKFFNFHFAFECKEQKFVVLVWQDFDIKNSVSKSEKNGIRMYDHPR